MNLNETGNPTDYDPNAILPDVDENTREENEGKEIPEYTDDPAVNLAKVFGSSCSVSRRRSEKTSTMRGRTPKSTATGRPRRTTTSPVPCRPKPTPMSTLQT